MGINRNNGESTLVIVVEYLETSISRDLLYKFPNNSAFDFDYAQSSIWSPLLPPPIHSYQEKNGLSVSRKLSYEEGDGLLENTKKMTAKFKRKFTNAVFDHLHKYQKMKRRKRKSMEFSSVPSSHQLTPTSPAPRKVWTKVLKAASKHFKKRKGIPLP